MKHTDLTTQREAFQDATAHAYGASLAGTEADVGSAAFQLCSTANNLCYALQVATRQAYEGGNVERAYQLAGEAFVAASVATREASEHAKAIGEPNTGPMDEASDARRQAQQAAANADGAF